MRKSAADSRQGAMEGLGLVDTDPDERFARITSLARELLEVQTATIVLVDRDRSGDPDGDVSPTPFRRTTSIHDRLLRAREMVVVEDMTTDARFADSPLVTGPPNIRFLASHPLEAPDGQPAGVLCLLDPRPRTLAAGERSALAELALWAQDELNDTAEQSRAAAVHRGLLPQLGRLEVPGYELAATCIPSRTVGGDLVDYCFAPDGDVVITIGDVMGKGVGAAIMMASVRAAMRSAGRHNAPAEAVYQAAASLEEDLRRTSTIVTLSHIRLDPATGRISYADAGHGLCLLVRDGEILNRPGRGGLPLGVVPDHRWPESVGRLEPGDTMVAFSDGLLDLFDGLDAAIAAVVGVVTGSTDAYAIVEHIDSLARRRPPADDIAFFALRRSRSVATTPPADTTPPTDTAATTTAATDTAATDMAATDTAASTAAAIDTAATTTTPPADTSAEAAPVEAAPATDTPAEDAPPTDTPATDAASENAASENAASENAASEDVPPADAASTETPPEDTPEDSERA